MRVIRVPVSEERFIALGRAVEDHEALMAQADKQHAPMPLGHVVMQAIAMPGELFTPGQRDVPDETVLGSELRRLLQVDPDSPIFGAYHLEIETSRRMLAAGYVGVIVLADNIEALDTVHDSVNGLISNPPSGTAAERRQQLRDTIGATIEPPDDIVDQPDMPRSA